MNNNMNNRYGAFGGAVPPRLPRATSAPTEAYGVGVRQACIEQRDGYRVIYEKQEAAQATKEPTPVVITGDNTDNAKLGGGYGTYPQSYSEYQTGDDAIVQYARLEARIAVLSGYRAHMQELADEISAELEQAQLEMNALEAEVGGHAVSQELEPSYGSPVATPYYAQPVEQTTQLQPVQFAREYDPRDYNLYHQAPGASDPAMGFINSIMQQSMQGSPEMAIRVQTTRLIPGPFNPRQYGG
jgi:hypothetical protein